MNPQSFESWKTRYRQNSLIYGNSIWENIGTHQLDILFLALGKMFIEANPEQRIEIKNVFNTYEQTWQLVIFIRRLGKLINLTKQEELVEIGLAIAEVTVERNDYRDIMASLGILKYGAEKVRIDTKKPFEEASVNYSKELGELIYGVIHWSKNDVSSILYHFGPKKWV